MEEIEFNRSAINPGDCIGTAWTLVTSNLGMYIGSTVVAAVIYFAASFIPFVNVLIMVPLMGGLYYQAIHNVDGEPVDFAMMFKGFEKLGPLLLLTFIENLPTIVILVLVYTGQFATSFFGLPMPDLQQGGTSAAPLDPRIFAGVSAALVALWIVFFIFSIVWSLIFFFAIQLVMDKNIGVIEAISTSARASFSNAGGAIVLMILSGLVILLGAIAICIGLFVAFPVVWVATAAAYRMVFPRLSQTYLTTPPPPTAYGNSFGQGMQ
jgi:uncharacterized membrane protein